MITKTKIIRDINLICDNTPVTFKSFGGFFLKLMMFPVEDQEFIVDSLMKAAKKASSADNIVIYSVDRINIELRKKEKNFRFILGHEFKCRHCQDTYQEETNIYNGKFRSVCEICMDKFRDYVTEQTPKDYD